MEYQVTGLHVFLLKAMVTQAMVTQAMVTQTMVTQAMVTLNACNHVRTEHILPPCQCILRLHVFDYVQYGTIIVCETCREAKLSE